MTPLILVGYCPVTEDRAPVEFALAAARVASASVLVVATHPGLTPVDAYSGGELARARGARAREALASLRDDFGSALEVRNHEATTPSSGLTAVAEEVGASLIVLGSSTRSAIGLVLVGSTAERVVHGAPAPVAVVPRGYAAPERIDAVGAAYVPTEEGEQALRAAAMLADAVGATLRVVTALNPRLAEHQSPGLLAASHHELAGDEQRAAELRLEAQRAVDGAIAGLSPALTIERDVLFQDPADALAAASKHLDVLVIGSRAYGPLRAVMLGGVSRRVITRAACPVLVLPRATTGGLDDLIAASGRTAAG